MRNQNTVAHLRREFDAAVREGATGRTYTVALVQSAITDVVAATSACWIFLTRMWASVRKLIVSPIRR